MNIDKYISLHYKAATTNRPIIILGSTSGIGKEACFILAKLKYRLVLANRNRTKGETLKKELLNEFPNSNIELLNYDQSSFDSINNLIEQIKNNYNDFHSLIINAGVFHENKSLLCYNRIPLVMMTNFIGPTYLINKLNEINNLSSDEHKIIFVGSLSKTFKKYKGDLLVGDYSLSKLGIYNLFYNSYINNNKDNMKYLIMEPGVSMTNIIRNLPRAIRFLANIIMPIFSNSPKKGSLGIISASIEENSSGNIYIPKHFFHFKGYPKISKINKKIIDKEIIDHANKLIEETNIL